MPGFSKFQENSAWGIFSVGFSNLWIPSLERTLLEQNTITSEKSTESHSHCTAELDLTVLLWMSIHSIRIAFQLISAHFWGVLGQAWAQRWGAEVGTSWWEEKAKETLVSVFGPNTSLFHNWQVNHTIIEWFRLEETLKIIWFLPSRHWHGHLPLDLAAQSPRHGLFMGLPTTELHGNLPW